MNTLPSVVWAEIRKLASRPIARFGLLVLAALGALGPLALRWLESSGVTLNGGDIGANFDVSAPNGVEWALVAREYSFASFVLLAVLVAVTFAGELQSHTLREDLIRPVPRWVVLLAKWVALAGWVVTTLAAQAAVASAIGLLVHPAVSVDGALWSEVLLGYAAAAAAEISFAMVALAISVVVRSVAGTVVGVVLFTIFERIATWVAQGLRAVVTSMSTDGEPSWVFEIIPFTPTSAWSGWTEIVDGTDPSWQPWVALVVWTGIAMAAAERMFARMDV